MSCQHDAYEHRRPGRPLLLAKLDVSARFASVSAGWATVLGWEDRALLGESFVARVHPDDLEGAVGAIHSALSSGASASFLARHAHRDGSYLPLRWRIAPRLDTLQIHLLGRALPRRPRAAQPPHETPR